MPSSPGLNEKEPSGQGQDPDQPQEEPLPSLKDWNGSEPEQHMIAHLRHTIKVMKRRQVQLEAEIRELKKEAVDMRAEEREQLMTQATKDMHLDKARKD